jgi:hypothetical protein
MNNPQLSASPNGLDWQKHEKTIRQLYVDGKKTLSEVMAIMSTAHEFHAT